MKDFKLLISCLLLASGMFCYSCKENDSGVDLGKMSVTIDSKSYTANSNSVSDSINKTFVIKGVSETDGVSVVINFSGLTVEEKEYILGPINNTAFVNTLLTDSSKTYKANGLSGSGKVTITNLTKDNVQGSFNFEAVSENNLIKKKVTGSFNSTITYKQ